MDESEDLARLRTDLEGKSPGDPAHHLDDEMMVEYSLGALDDRQVATADAHLAACEACAARLEGLLTLSVRWEGAQGQQHLEDLSRKILAGLEASARPANGTASPGRTTFGSWSVWSLGVAASVALAVGAAWFAAARRQDPAVAPAAQTARVTPPEAESAPPAPVVPPMPPPIASVARSDEPRLPPPVAPVPGLPAGVLTSAAGRSIEIGRPVALPEAPAAVPERAVARPAAVAPPTAVPAASVPTAAAAAGGGASTAFPPDLPDVPAQRKRMLMVQPFTYATVTSWVNYWFGSNYNIGDGIRSMLQMRLNDSPTIAMLQRGTNGQALLAEQDLNASNRVRQGTGARIAGVTGADAILIGEIVIFGRDDTTKRKGLGAVVGGLFGPAAGGLVTLDKEEKAVVGITLRLVDAQTTEVIVSAEARGESSRQSKDYAGVLGAKGGAAAGGTSMTSSNFQNTIIGEATSNSVADVVRILQEKLSQIPARPREIEGRVAALTATGPFLNVGGNSGVLRGDRFEILRVDSEIRDPVTGDVIGTNSVKLGELVVHTVQATGASGQYGGQPLNDAYLKLKDKGYLARLISR